MLNYIFILIFAFLGVIVYLVWFRKDTCPNCKKWAFDHNETKTLVEIREDENVYEHTKKCSSCDFTATRFTRVKNNTDRF